MGDTMNFSELINGTTKDDYNPVSSIQVASTVLTNIVCALGIPSNAFVIWIAGVKMKATVNTVWYVNLAVADLICCLVTPFFYLRTYGAALCKFLPMAVSLNRYANAFILTLISLDRGAMVLRPVWAQNQRSISGARLLCGLAWLLALFLCLPQLIYREICEVNNRTCCIKNQSVDSVINIIQVVFGFLVPLLVITVCYLLIARKVSVSVFKSQKALTIMFGVVMAFFICWMPFHIMNLTNNRSHALFPLVISLAYFSSCLNPLLYVFIGQDFKQKVRVSLRRTFESAFTKDFVMSSSQVKSRSAPPLLLQPSTDQHLLAVSQAKAKDQGRPSFQGGSSEALERPPP